MRNLPIFMIIIGFFLITTPIRAVEYFVATNGNNSNTGTQAQPFKTIQRAADVALPGDIITVRGGTYRERVTPPRGGNSETTRIVYRAAAGEEVWIKGSDIWQPSWNFLSGTVYAAMPNASMFTDNVYFDGQAIPFKVLVDWPTSLGQVFVDGQRYSQVGSLSQVNSTPKTWYYDDGTGIAIHFPDNTPNNHQVEITVRRSIFRPHIKGLGYITVQGFHMHHAASMPYNWVGNSYGPSKDQHAALDARGGHHWIIKENDVQYSKAIGIDVGGYGSDYDNEVNPAGSYNAMYNDVIDNIASNNGTLGISASLSASGGSPGHIQIIGNIVENNNYLHRQSYEEGGIKTHQLNDSIIANNLVRNNFGEGGIWLDWHWRRVRVTGNLLVNNQAPNNTDQGRNLYLEAGGCAYDTSGPGCGEDSVLVDNNIMIGKYGEVRESRVDYSIANIVTKAYNIEISTSTNNNINYILGSLSQSLSGTNVIASGSLGSNNGNLFTYNFETNTITWDVPSSFIGINSNPPALPFATISSDYFGDTYGSIKKAGSIQKIVQGQNQFVVWPKNGGTLPPSTTVARPMISPQGGSVTGPVVVTLATTTAGATIYYTLDGSTPNRTSTLYTSAFTITPTTTLTVKAYAIKEGLDDSGVAELSYTYVEPAVIQLPGRLEAEDYALGGEGQAYHDTSIANEGGAYRNDAVDIQNTLDVLGAYNVGWTAQGEWLEYDINVAQAGTYQLIGRVASAYTTNRELLLSIDGSNVVQQTFSLDRGDWQAWQDVHFGEVVLTQGKHKFRVTHISGDINLNYFDFILGSSLIEGDVDEDGDVDLYDYQTLVNHFNTNYPAADFDRNGLVDIFDYSKIITHFGMGQ